MSIRILSPVVRVNPQLRRRLRRERVICADSKVSGMGSAALDYLAAVKAYPAPDQKIRTESFEVQGGGNCGNALTGAAKLGLKPSIITKLGDDSIGSQTLSQLQDEGIDTSCMVIAKNRTSGFTYIIVDQAGETRTCIHTPMEPLSPAELNPDSIEQFLNNSEIVYFDGRLTEAAISVAKKAREKNIEVLVEAERLRPDLEELLKLADVIVTSKNFPQDFTGEQCLGDALISMIRQFPNTKLLITTLGSKGAIALELTHDSKRSSDEIALESALEDCWKKLESDEVEQGSEPDCIAKNGTLIWSGNCLVFPQEFRPALSRSVDDLELVQASIKERARNAALADAKSASAFSGYKSSTEGQEISTSSFFCRLTVASASKIAKEAVVDTTGAGDAFMSGVLHGLINQFSLRNLLRFSSIVAACKCTEIGARSGQPTLSNFSNYDQFLE